VGQVREVLHTRREQLIARSDSQRDEITREVEGLRTFFAATDFALGVASYVRGRGHQLASDTGTTALGRWPLAVRWLLQGNRIWRWARLLLGL
jgi:hypothetical protein